MDKYKTNCEKLSHPKDLDFVVKINGIIGDSWVTFFEGKLLYVLDTCKNKKAKRDEVQKAIKQFESLSSTMSESVFDKALKDAIARARAFS